METIFNRLAKGTKPDLGPHCMIPYSPSALCDAAYHSDECKDLRSYLFYLGLGILFFATIQIIIEFRNVKLCYLRN